MTKRNSPINNKRIKKLLKYQKTHTMKKLLLIFILLGTSWMLNAQFSSAVTIGITANQVNGDGMAGFNKIGLTGGLALSYPVNEHWDISMEMLYAQKGSSQILTYETNIKDDYGIHLEYLEIPIFLRIKDWYEEDKGYYKAFLDVGFNTGYMFTADTKSTFFADDIGNFNKIDFSLMAGLGFNFNQRWGINLRYTRSLVPIFNVPGFAEVDPISFNWSLETYYNL